MLMPNFIEQPYRQFYSDMYEGKTGICNDTYMPCPQLPVYLQQNTNEIQ